MTLFGEFKVPSDIFVLGQTLRELPETVLEIERVVASGRLLTPYFWVVTDDVAAFEARAGSDPTIDNLHRVDEFETRTLYRAEWTENIDALLYAYQDVGAAITEATGQDAAWELRIRFEDQQQLDDFQSFCRDNGVDYELERRYEASRVGKGAEYGLTPKQHKAATKAWEMGYFDSPREVTLSTVADELGISTQALSDRLRRAQHNLMAETLFVTSPSDPGYRGGET